MAKLIAFTPFGDMLPLSVGGVTVSEVLEDSVLSIAPFHGQHKAVSDACKDQIGVGLPVGNKRSGALTWFGHGTYLTHQSVSLDGLAAVTDQSDAWAVVRIEGDSVEAVLARLVPLDLRLKSIGVNDVAKTMLGHLSVTLVRVGQDAFEIFAMRSMAATLVHDLDVAMRGVAAR